MESKDKMPPARSFNDDVAEIDRELESTIARERDAQFDREVTDIKQAGIDEYRKMAQLGFVRKQEVEEIIAKKDKEIAELREEWGKLKSYALRKIAQGENPVGQATNLTEQIDPKAKERKELEEIYGDLRTVPGYPD